MTVGLSAVTLQTEPCVTSWLPAGRVRSTPEGFPPPPGSPAAPGPEVGSAVPPPEIWESAQLSPTCPGPASELFPDTVYTVYTVYRDTVYRDSHRRSKTGSSGQW